jgi:hypothetical protein
VLANLSQGRYQLPWMNPDLTHLLTALDQGDPHAASRVLPLVDDELRKLAALRMAQELPEQMLNAMARRCGHPCDEHDYRRPGAGLVDDRGCWTWRNA